MKQIIPFSKDITFKTKVEEITSISLDHDLQLKGDDLVTGNFYIKGKFKMTKASQIEDDFNYKIPCEIAISDDYDTYDALIDIDDFYYDLVNDEVLKVNIAVSIENLVKKEKVVETKIEDRNDEIKINYDSKEEVEVRENPINIIKDVKNDIFNKEDTYSTYYVYLVKEDDSFATVMEKYHVTKEDILKYNDLKELQTGMKLVIPEVKNE